jgi:hypothetical protein
MLALKKKREAEAKAAAEAASTPSSAPSSAGESTSSADNKVSLLGIGGKKKTKENGGGGKKRTPGEIRIQKGKWCICIVDFLEWLFEHCFVVHKLVSNSRVFLLGHSAIKPPVSTKSNTPKVVYINLFRDK